MHKRPEEAAEDDPQADGGAMDYHAPDAASEGEDDRAIKFELFARAIAAKRDEAVAARSASGIEETWSECEESYHGIDDTNRHEFANARWLKPTTMASGLTTERPKNGAGANAFVRMTARYVDAGAAKVSEITIPVDGKAFSMKATPVPDAIRLKDDKTPFAPPGMAPAMRPAGPDDMPPADPMATPSAPQQPQPMIPGGAAAPMPGQPQQPAPPPQVPVTVGDLAKHAIEQAEESAEKAETRIHDWMIECQHTQQLRKVLFDGARLGVGVLKGPVPDVVQSKSVVKGPQGIELTVISKTVPVTKWVDPWNFFPDPACGENIHDGDYCLERDHLTYGKLEALKDTGIYINEAIDRVLAEGPDNAFIAANGDRLLIEAARRRQFQIWYFYGLIQREELDIANPKLGERLRKRGDERTSVYVIVTLVNNTPIRVTLNPLEKTGSFPYRTFSWRRRSGFWAGIGVAEQIRFPQKLINSATRAMVSNAAKSSGCLLVIDNDLLIPMDGSWLLTPDKLFGRNPESVGGGPFDARQAAAAIQIPNTTAQLMAIVEYAFKLAEESSNIPLITQGQSGDTTPDTFGGQQLQDNNANQLLRDVGYSVADGITNPLVRDMYEWLLLDPDVPDDEKGDHQVDANAACAMIEKALQDRMLMMMAAGPLAQDPGFGFDKFKFGKALARVNRFNPSDLMVSDEEYEQRKKAPPPPVPMIEATKLKVQSAEKIAQSRDQLAAHKVDVDTDRDRAYLDSQDRRDQNDADATIRKLELQLELARINAAERRQTALDNNKVKLADTTMKLAVQKELSADDRGADLHKHHTPPQIATPPNEPAGQAKAGEAYEA